jgi:RNA polymerase sigma factor (sigma-70 family)
MAAGPITQVLRELRRAALLQDGGGPSDAELLDAFLLRRDGPAFETLVRRHGPTVYALCQRLLGNSHDAADAFQAVFLVLVEKARSIRSRAALGAWLYGVAYRTSLKARARRQRRQSREKPTAGVPEPGIEMDVPNDDMLALLDEELNGLPEKYRVPVVLCELQGKSRHEAAQALGLPEGTLSSRLATARRLLRERLTGRGVVLSAEAVTAALACSAASAQVPAELVVSTVQAGTAALTRGAVAGVVSAEVVALKEGVVKAMFLSKLKIAAGLLCVVFLTSAGVVLLESGLFGQPPAGAPAPIAGVAGPKTDEPAVQQPPSPVGKLLGRLKELRPKAGNDEWANVLRDLVKLGPAAVPELIAALDATEDEFMLRCLGFVVRGIGDKRVVPALIRALPRTCAPPSSDYGFTAQDPELLAFMQKHGYDKREGGTHYSFGRAINEFRVTLQKFTGSKHGEDEIVHVFLEGTARQQFLQRALYQRCAERWAQWWEQRWKEHVSDERYARVNLAPLAEGPLAVSAFPQGPRAAVTGRHSNHLLESVRDPRAKTVFLDLDTGRASPLPKQLRVAQGQPERLDDILAWAAREGFDLMGTEYTPPGDSKPHYVLRGLGLSAWQIKTERWQTLEEELRDNRRLDMGTRTDGLLARFEMARGQYVPEETGTFLFQTREGGYGALFVGVEVHDSGQRAGGPATEEDELNPVAFAKGRRFAYSLIELRAADREGPR